MQIDCTSYLEIILYVKIENVIDVFLFYIYMDRELELGFPAQY